MGQVTDARLVAGALTAQLELTVSRTAQYGGPKASDFPADMRATLRRWLDEAEETPKVW